jgi:predicted Zn-dependent peptidase
MNKCLLLIFLIASSGCIQKPLEEETQKYVLDNGLVLLVKENHANRIVATKLLVRIGAGSEASSAVGIRNFVQRTLLKGTDQRTAEEIAFETDSKGISISTGVADDYMWVTVVSTREFFTDGMEILADLVQHPTFPDGEVEAERRRILEEIRAQEDDPFTETLLLFKKGVYGDHPYGYNPLGTEESVRKIGREDLRRFHERRYVPNRMVMAVVGDVRADEAKEWVERSFRGFPSREPPEEPEFGLLTERAILSKEKEREQSFLLIGFQAAPVTSRDYPALKVLNSILGGGSGSRLFEKLREERGLAYAVGSFYPTRMETSYLAAYIGTAPPNEEAVRERILEEFNDLKSAPVPEEELTRSKNRILGEFELDHESNERQATYLAWYEAIGMGYGYDEEYPVEVERVTPDDVQRVARKYFVQPVTARVGPP